VWFALNILSSSMDTRPVAAWPTDFWSAARSLRGTDATRKWASEGFPRPWPDEIVMDAKTKALVDAKWKALAKELGIG